MQNAFQKSSLLLKEDPGDAKDTIQKKNPEGSVKIFKVKAVFPPENKVSRRTLSRIKYPGGLSQRG